MTFYQRVQLFTPGQVVAAAPVGIVGHEDVAVSQLLALVPLSCCTRLCTVLWTDLLKETRLHEVFAHSSKR